MSEDERFIRKLEQRLSKLKSLAGRVEDILEGIVNDEVIQEIKRKMFAADYSIRIIDNVELRNVRVEENKIKYEVWNELLVGEGFDIAVGREEGIPEHDIFGNPVLVFPGKTAIGTPTDIFAKKVEHPGVEATHIIRDTVREKEQTVQNRYQKEVKTRIKQISS